MKRAMIQWAAFCRAVKQLGMKNPLLLAAIRQTSEMLQEEAFDPRLRTHKLKGDLTCFWSRSAGYDLRIVFEIVPHAGTEAILLVS
jgi:mRNA-degrading endonuclease YafQ of YafQ-DinJ toxin-antitoxin module